MFKNSNFSLVLSYGQFLMEVFTCKKENGGKMQCDKNKNLHNSRRKMWDFKRREKEEVNLPEKFSKWISAFLFLETFNKIKKKNVILTFPPFYFLQMYSLTTTDKSYWNVSQQSMVGIKDYNFDTLQILWGMAIKKKERKRWLCSKLFSFCIIKKYRSENLESKWPFVLYSFFLVEKKKENFFQI